MAHNAAHQPANRPVVTGIESFAAESTHFMAQVSQAAVVTMHVFDQHGRRVWVGSQGVPPAFREAYYDRQMWRIDPLGAIRTGGSPRAMTDLQSAEQHPGLEHAARYRAFLGAFGIVNAAELVFRSGEELLGGMSLLWRGASAGSARLKLDTLAHVHRYIQVSLQNALGGTLIGWRRTLVGAFELSARELQVVEGVCAGQTNRELGESLGISLATVKTHLAHIYQKVGVANRAALVQRTLGNTRH